MREIKFRGKRLDNGEWVYGYFYSYVRDDNGKTEYCILQDISSIASDFKINYVDPSTVGQYTGLKDKNGKEIYKGDILIWCMENMTLRGTPYQQKPYRLGDKLVVRWLESGFTLSVPSNTHHEPNVVGNVNNYDFWNNHRFFEVIGNLYDNPELKGVIPCQNI